MAGAWVWVGVMCEARTSLQTATAERFVAELAAPAEGGCTPWEPARRENPQHLPALRADLSVRVGGTECSCTDTAVQCSCVLWG